MRWMCPWARGVLVATTVLASCAQAERLPPLRSGDLIFHTSRSRQSKAIQAATHSVESHVGIIEVAPDGTFVVEAIQPVSRTPIAQWLARGEGRHLRILRVRSLSSQQASNILRAAKRFLGRPYDAQFGPGDEAL